MKKFKFLSVIAITLLASLLLVSCGGKDQGNGDGGNNGSGDSGTKEKITLTVWGSQEDQEMLKEMCAAYAAANPDKEYKFLCS